MVEFELDFNFIHDECHAWKTMKLHKDVFQRPWNDAWISKWNSWHNDLLYEHQMKVDCLWPNNIKKEG